MPAARRKKRHQLTAEINDSYQRGDEDRIRAILRRWLESDLASLRARASRVRLSKDGGLHGSHFGLVERIHPRCGVVGHRALAAVRLKLLGRGSQAER